MDGIVKKEEREELERWVSFTLTRVLLLYGRLVSAYNARYLPITVRSLESMLQALREKQDQEPGIARLISENLVKKQQLCFQFFIPPIVQKERSLSSLYAALCELVDPLVPAFCRDERHFIMQQESEEIRSALMARARRHCESLQNFCGKNAQIQLGILQSWCEHGIQSPGPPLN